MSWPTMKRLEVIDRHFVAALPFQRAA